MADVSHAGLLKPAADLQIAVPEYQMAEYVVDPDLAPVPLAPQHCRSVLFWQDKIVPLMELAQLAGNDSAGPVESVVVMAYQNQPGAPLRYVGIAVAEPPARIPVDDEQVCDPAEDYADCLRAVTLSCFSHDGQPTTILNLERLGSVDFRKLAVAGHPRLPAFPRDTVRIHLPAWAEQSNTPGLHRTAACEEARAYFHPRPLLRWF